MPPCDPPVPPLCPWTGRRRVEDSLTPSPGRLCQRRFPFSPPPCTCDTIFEETCLQDLYAHTSSAGTGDGSPGRWLLAGVSTRFCRDAFPRPFVRLGAVGGCGAPRAPHGPSLSISALQHERRQSLSSGTRQVTPAIPDLGVVRLQPFK